MAFIYDLLDTWNNAGTVFSGIKLNVTNTASAAGSKLIDLQIGGSTFFNVDKSGQVELLAGTAAAPTLIPTGDTNTGIWFPAADTIAASTGGTERLRITSAGRVGIGTSAPNDLLEVREGNFRVTKTSGIPSFILRSQQAAGYNPAFAQFTRVGAGSTATPDNSSIAEIRFDGLDASNAYAAFAYIQAGIGVNAAGGAPGYFAFYTSPSGGVAAERLRIDSSGNVGINTAVPTTLLSVNGIASFGAGTAALPSIAAFGDLDTGMWFPAANTLAWSTGGSERMRIRSDGNIGIGTTGDAGTSVNIFRNLTGATTMYVLSFSCQVQSDVTSSVSGVFTNIGTANASFTTSINHFFTFQGTFGASSTVSQQTGYVSGPTLIGATTNYAFRAANTAAVGAGKTAYGYYSAINTATGGGTTWAFYGEGTAPSYFAGQVQLGAGTAALPSVAAFGDLDTGMWWPAANTLAWSTGGSERMRITSAGNLGLGTSTFGTSAATTFAIATGTAPTTGPADTIQIYSTDLSAGNTMLSLYTEGTVVNANTTAAATHRIAIRVNGTVYYLLANTSST